MDKHFPFACGRLPRMVFRMVLRLFLCWTLMAGLGAGLRADTTQSMSDWDSVTVAPMKTSIYVGSVTLTTSEFRREGDKFSATYEAKVWPWFFWGETGSITIGLPPADLAKLAKGERVEFTGDAVNNHSKPRKITGRADRVGGATGKIKVRISVDGTELVFNGDYRFNNAMK